jgi:hypothetical protein
MIVQMERNIIAQKTGFQYRIVFIPKYRERASQGKFPSPDLH